MAGKLLRHSSLIGLPNPGASARICGLGTSPNTTCGAIPFFTITSCNAPTAGRPNWFLSHSRWHHCGSETRCKESCCPCVEMPPCETGIIGDQELQLAISAVFGQSRKSDTAFVVEASAKWLTSPICCANKSVVGVTPLTQGVAIMGHTLQRKLRGRRITQGRGHG